MYCEFEETGDVFKNKKIYKCKNCNLTLALENPDAKITCFSYSRTVFNQELDNDVMGRPLEVKSQAEIDALAHNIIEQQKQQKPQNIDAPPSQALCTDEQISERLAICNNCEFYEKNACTLCGCQIVREKNYM